MKWITENVNPWGLWVVWIAYRTLGERRKEREVSVASGVLICSIWPPMYPSSPQHTSSPPLTHPSLRPWSLPLLRSQK